MKKKSIRFLMVMMVIVLAIAMSACGDDKSSDDSSGGSGGAPVEKQKDESDQNDDSAKEEKEASNSSSDGAATSVKNFKTSKNGTIVVIESGYRYDGEGSLEVGALVGNANSESAFVDFGLTITAYADDGSILGTEDVTQFTIQPGEIRPFSTSIETKDKEPKKVEIEAIEGDEEKADSKAIKTSDLAVSNVSENVDKEDESISYTGQITNKSKTDTDGGMVVVLLKNKGKIVGTGYEYVDVKAGKKKAFDFTVYGLIEHDKYEMYAYSDYVSD